MVHSSIAKSSKFSLLHYQISTRVNRYSIARVDRENRKKSLIGSEEMNERKTNRQNEFKRIIHKIWIIENF